jgi:hypothetical protein
MFARYLPPYPWRIWQIIRIRWWSPFTDHGGSGAYEAVGRWAGCRHARNAQELDDQVHAEY